jgi:primosomal protein N' (replication factor Y)
VRVRAGAPAPLSGGPAVELLPHYDNGAALLQAIATRTPGAWVLQASARADHGRLISELVAVAVNDGGSEGAALVMVPEIRYGSQVLSTMAGSFPELARIDSAQSDADRTKGLLRLAAGHGLGAGGRSAVLAPVPDLRLIVLDEEHHRTYKEDRSPRYDARRVALERARLQDTVCVFVSSTPSLEAGWAARSGVFGWAGPSRAEAQAARPRVELVAPPPAGLSDELHGAMRDVLRGGGKVALLAGRPGFARTLWCASCSRSVRCPRCEAGVAYSRGNREVRCPRCALTAQAPDICPTCGSHDFRFIGAGSERLGEQLAKMFPRSRVARVDPDILEAPDEDLAAQVAEADIYVTTWIGTKPSIRPDVSLVGVLDADWFIRRPDFRAAETAYQALAAMSEWAGPASAGGRLILHAAEPGHHAVQAVVRGDYGYFLERECEQRRELSYPPFTELVKVQSSGPQARALIDQAAAAAREHGGQVLGPIPVREPQRQNKRAASDGRQNKPGPADALEILVKCPDAGAVAAALRVILPGVPNGSRLRVDVDPR